MTDIAICRQRAAPARSCQPLDHERWLPMLAGLLPLLDLACGARSAAPGDAGRKEDQVGNQGKVEKKDGQAPGKLEGKDEKDQPAKPPKEGPGKQQTKDQVDQRWVFTDTPPGQTPPGWNFTGGQISIQEKQGRRAMELVGDLHGTAATLPPVVLKDPFFLELEVEFPQKNANLDLQLFGKGNRFFYVTLDADAQVMLHNSLPAAGAKHWQAGKVNRVRLERRGPEFVVKINCEPVESGKFPSAATLIASWSDCSTRTRAAARAFTPSPWATKLLPGVTMPPLVARQVP